MLGAVGVRAWIYALIAFLTPVIGVVVETTKGGEFPTSAQLVGAAASGLAATLVTLRAFIDGTVERNK